VPAPQARLAGRQQHEEEPAGEEERHGYVHLCGTSPWRGGHGAPGPEQRDGVTNTPSPYAARTPPRSRSRRRSGSRRRSRWWGPPSSGRWGTLPCPRGGGPGAGLCNATPMTAASQTSAGPSSSLCGLHRPIHLSAAALARHLSIPLAPRTRPRTHGGDPEGTGDELEVRVGACRSTTLLAENGS
jgi:hypothetical protein